MKSQTFGNTGANLLSALDGNDTIEEYYGNDRVLFEGIDPSAPGLDPQRPRRAMAGIHGASAAPRSRVGRRRTGMDFEAGVRARSAWWSSGTSPFVSG